MNTDPLFFPVNPYIAGNPVSGGEAFIGRADVLREVLRVVRSPDENALVLYGQRRIGKTSVLQELAARLPKEGPYYPVDLIPINKAALPLAQVVKGDRERCVLPCDLYRRYFEDKL
jgi:predicted AAA+ superfamily ATPase